MIPQYVSIIMRSINHIRYLRQRPVVVKKYGLFYIHEKTQKIPPPSKPLWTDHLNPLYPLSVGVLVGMVISGKRG